MNLKGSLARYRNQNRILAETNLLKSLTHTQRHEFLQFCHRRKYEEGEFIFYQNDPGTGMYFIETGTVELIFEASGNESDEPDLRYEIQSPGYFGEHSIGYDLRRFASARCLSDCVLLGFFKPDLDTLQKRHPSIAAAFLESLSFQVMKQLEYATAELESVSGSATVLQFRKSLCHRNREKETL
ncbi:MAG: cyclic nucleotide-binding domain-containing protein [Balneolaceae bacterium]